MRTSKDSPRGAQINKYIQAVRETTDLLYLGGYSQIIIDYTQDTEIAIEDLVEELARTDTPTKSEPIGSLVYRWGCLLEVMEERSKDWTLAMAIKSLLELLYSALVKKTSK